MNPNAIKIFQSLISPILLAGAPRSFAILNGTFCVALVFALQSFYAIPICLMLHIAAVIATKKDAHFFEVIFRHLQQKSYYDV